MNLKRFFIAAIIALSFAALCRDAHSQCANGTCYRYAQPVTVQPAPVPQVRQAQPQTYALYEPVRPYCAPLRNTYRLWCGKPRLWRYRQATVPVYIYGQSR